LKLETWNNNPQGFAFLYELNLFQFIRFITRRVF
jgi:hypothetical protein